MKPATSTLAWGEAMAFFRSFFRGALLVVGTIGAVSCTGPDQPCNPSDPLCGDAGQGPDPTVATITVASPIDSVMAVGRSVQLSASAADATGTPVSGVAFTWASTSTSTATVSGTGLVVAVAAGTTTIGASADGIVGSLPMRAVDADLDGVSATLNERFAQAIRGELDASTASTLNGILSMCSSSVTSGHVLAIEACLADALNAVGVDGTDTALLGVLALFWEHAQRQLQLGR